MLKSLVAPNLLKLEPFFDRLFSQANFSLLEKVIQEDDQIYWRGYVDNKYSFLISITNHNDNVFLKVSLGLYVVDKNNSDHHELCIDLLTLNEEVFLVNGKIGLEKDIVVLGFNFILSLIEFQHIESFFENWISVAEEHFENIEQKYALLPLVTSKSSYRTH